MKNVLHDLARIVQTVAQADQPIDQVNLIVQSISATMAVDVCSLYLVNAEQEMELLASQGLAAGAVRRVRLPRGEGLVGLVASTRHPVNIADAALHPAHYYVPETEEERFRSFCGLPLVHGGTVIGVLVVQCCEPRLLTTQEQGFLVTLAAHLALLLVNSPLVAAAPEGMSNRVTGVKGAPGIGIGHIRLCHQGELYAVADVPCGDIPGALTDWHLLLQTVKADLEREKADLGSELAGSVGGIYTAYQMLLEDPAFVRYVETGITQGNWLPGALRKATQHFADVFLAMDDPYLRARHEDIHHLGNKLYNAWRGAKPAFALTAAGQNRRFVDMADGVVLGFGPRSAAVLDALARAVYAP